MGGCFIYVCLIRCIVIQLLNGMVFHMLGMSSLLIIIVIKKNVCDNVAIKWNGISYAICLVNRCHIRVTF